MSKNSKSDAGKKMKAKKYEKELRKLQAELCKLQDWVKHKGLRVIVIFEGRDGAGKGGTIRAITERVSTRVFRVVALPAPSDREKTQMYIQRYMQHFHIQIYASAASMRAPSTPGMAMPSRCAMVGATCRLVIVGSVRPRAMPAPAARKKAWLSGWPGRWPCVPR